MKKVMLAIMLLGLFSTAFASDFLMDDYKWSSTIEEIKARLKDENKYIIKSESGILEYKDKIFKEDCKVVLGFCMLRYLNSITIIWEGPGIKSKIQQLITEKFGQPKIFSLGAGARRCAWQLDDANKALVQPYRMVTNITDPLIHISLELNDNQPVTKLTYSNTYTCYQTGSFKPKK